MQFAQGFLLALVISYVALRGNSLSSGGATAAVAVGTVVFGFGGVAWAILLLVFFVSSSILSHSFRERRAGREDRYAKGGRRDAAQVLANGAVAAIFAALTALFPHSPWPWLGYGASLAAANADTWATELSLLGTAQPRLVTHWNRPVPPGTSGAVSGLGMVAAIAGSASIGLVASLVAPSPGLVTFWPVLAGGFLGSMFDSFLGATVQARYMCAREQLETEQHPAHNCGSATVYIRGWKWLNNDWVNVGCTAFGALSACLLSIALGWV